MKDGFEEMEREKDNNSPEIKYAVVGINRERASELLRNGAKQAGAAEKVCIFYADKTAEIIEFNEEMSLEEIEAEMVQINQAIRSTIKNESNYKTLYSDDKAFEKIVKKAENIRDGKNNDKLKKIAIAAGIVVGAAVLGTSCAAIIDKMNDKEIEEGLEKVPSMDGKDLEFYSENALDTAQKELFLKNITAWLEDNNAKEEWMKTTLTEEQLKEYGFADAESVFGLTAEDAYSLALRFGHYSKDQYVTLTGGKEMDTVAIMNDAHSQSNGALSNIISYYICSDKCDLNIEKLINFNENEVAKINEIEGKLNEFKTLVSEGKEDEAKAKMVEMKAWFNEYAYSVDYEQDNAKSYILRTFLPACSALSQIYQYEDTISVELYDTVEDKQITKEIKTTLFDEITMRTLVLGFTECDAVGAFDAESYLEEHGISSDRYNLLNTDITSSIADKSVSAQSEKLEQANTYIANLRHDDVTADVITVNLEKGNIGDQVANQMDRNSGVATYITEYDELTHGTYDTEILFEMVNNHLKENNMYPKNINYFRTAKSDELSMEYKNTHGVTQGTVGDIITDTNAHKEDVNVNNIVVTPNDTVLDNEGNKTTMEEAKEEARQEEENKTGIESATTPEEEKEVEEEKKEEAIPRAELLAGVYNATFNHFFGSPVVEGDINTTNTYGQTYTDAWATSTDFGIKNAYNMAKEDALARKAKLENAGQTTGGEVIIEDEYKNAEISETQVEPTDEPEVDEPVEEPEIEDGYSTEPPAGFAPVVTSSVSEDALLAYLNTEEGNAWFESVTASEVNTNQTSYSK